LTLELLVRDNNQGASEISAEETTKVRMATVDEYVLPPDVTEAYKKAPRTDQKTSVRAHLE
jgi:hypothetical protein